MKYQITPANNDLEKCYVYKQISDVTSLWIPTWRVARAYYGNEPTITSNKLPWLQWMWAKRRRGMPGECKKLTFENEETARQFIEKDKEFDISEAEREVAIKKRKAVVIE